MTIRNMVRNIVRILLEIESHRTFIDHGKNDFISQKRGTQWKAYTKTGLRGSSRLEIRKLELTSKSSRKCYPSPT